MGQRAVALLGHLRPANAKINSLGSPSVNIPSAFKNLSGLNLFASGCRVSSRDVPLRIVSDLTTALRVSLTNSRTTHQVWATMVGPDGTLGTAHSIYTWGSTYTFWYEITLVYIALCNGVRCIFWISSKTLENFSVPTERLHLMTSRMITSMYGKDGLSSNSGSLSVPTTASISAWARFHVWVLNHRKGECHQC